MSSIAVIPARGGSKRIPQKNIKSFFGKPIIGYSIEAAASSGLFDRIVVSTDSEEIAAVARELGAEVPFMRPAAISGDFTPTVDVLLHTLDELGRKEEYRPQYLCCILATAPMLRSSDLREGYRMVASAEAPAAFGVTTFAFPILRALQLTASGALEMVWPEHELTRSNDLQEFYHDAGQFYWVECAALRREKRVYMQGARPVILPRHLVQDIDTPEDWLAAEMFFAASRERRNSSQNEPPAVNR